MSNQLPDHIVVMFADVAGSTRMYESLGDTDAHECISESLKRVVYHTKQHNGRLIETIGDEAMLTFDHVKNAVSAAMDIQQHFFRQPVKDQHFIKMRIGFHYGPIEYDAGNHPFGDTVNVAARVVSLCDGGRIIATRSTLEHAREHFKEIIRQYQRTHVKGKSEPLMVEEVVWDYEDATSLHEPTTQSLYIQAPPKKLTLVYNNHNITLRHDSSAFLIGRDPNSELQVDSSLASRSHARIEFRWGEVVLTDHSTNGTYIQAIRNNKGQANSTRLHRRETLLTGEGLIAIGASVEKAADDAIIRFKIEDANLS